MIPKDPAILLSFVNMKLRDSYSSLDDLCADLDVDPAAISAALSARPFGGLTTPLISNIASLINPIANTITIKVKGTLENPDIGVSINPINMLQGREKILDNMEESL